MNDSYFEKLDIENNPDFQEDENGDNLYNEDEIEEINEPFEEDTIISENGYTFKKDDLDRTLVASGDLRLKTGQRDIDAQLEAGGNDRHDGDDGGHLIGTRFDGPGGSDNLIAENSNVNRSGFKSLENEWAAELKNGSNIHVDIEPVYQEDVLRPYAITGDYDLTKGDTGQKEYFSFTNEKIDSDEFEIPIEDDDMLDDINKKN